MFTFKSLDRFSGPIYGPANSRFRKYGLGTLREDLEGFMSQELNCANLVAAIDQVRGCTEKGFTFLDGHQKDVYYSFDQLRTEAMHRAAHMRHVGLVQGDRLAMVIPDGIDFVPTFLAAVWAGIVPVPMYPPLSMGKLDSYMNTFVGILSTARVNYIVTTKKLQQLLWSGLAKVRGLKGVITTEELLTPAPQGVSQHPASVKGDDLCLLQFTSGSTSTPKGVVVTHENLRANTHAIIHPGLSIDTNSDRGVSWLPLYHDMGLIGFVIAPFFCRMPVTFIPTLAFVRNATIWLETIHRTKASVTFAPNFAYALVAKRSKPEHLARWDLSSMRHFGCGAEPINPNTMRVFLDTFTPCGVKPQMLLPSYGMAEATLAISFVGIEETLSTDIVDLELYQRDHCAQPPAVLGSRTQEFVCCGRAFVDHEVGIFDEDGKRLMDRNIGEIWVRGPSVTKGYFKDVENTNFSFSDGWLKTGDYGYLVSGNVYVTGRKKDTIIINGRNYDPQRMEWLVDELPEVRKGSTVAFSRPAANSEELIVVLESRTETPNTLVELVRQTLNEQLQLRAADVVICPVGTLPKTSSGKLQRSKTKQQYLTGTLAKRGNRMLSNNADKLVLARHFILSLFGRVQHRAKRIIQHLLSIRSRGDAFDKWCTLQKYVKRRFSRHY